jgi:hypothetical protein
MSGQTVRKTFKYKLKPTAEQEREFARVLGLRHALYNTALEQRRPSARPSSRSWVGLSLYV